MTIVYAGKMIARSRRDGTLSETLSSYPAREKEREEDGEKEKDRRESPRRPYATGTAIRSFATSAPSHVERSDTNRTNSESTRGHGGFLRDREQWAKKFLRHATEFPTGEPVISTGAGYRQISVLSDYFMRD